MNRSGYEYLVIASLLVSCASVMACLRSKTLGSGDSVLRDCVECPEMLVVSPGSFVMVSPPQRLDALRKRVLSMR